MIHYMLQIQKCQYVLCDFKKDTPRLNFRRAPRLFLGLFLHIHRHAGLKFHSEFILVDADLFNKPSDKLLVIFGEGCFSCIQNYFQEVICMKEIWNWVQVALKTLGDFSGWFFGGFDGFIMP